MSPIKTQTTVGDEVLLRPKGNHTEACFPSWLSSRTLLLTGFCGTPMSQGHQRDLGTVRVPRTSGNSGRRAQQHPPRSFSLNGMSLVGPVCWGKVALRVHSWVEAGLSGFVPQELLLALPCLKLTSRTCPFLRKLK